MEQLLNLRLRLVMKISKIKEILPSVIDDMFLNVGKAHQRKIREQKEKEYSSNKNIVIPENINIKNAKIKQILYKEAEKIILEYEWLGTMGTTQTHFGIYYDDILAGVACYGYFQAMQGYSKYIGEKYAKQGIQLSRGACVYWAHPHSASKLIGETLKIMNSKGYKFAIAFSDPEASEIGTVYQATNWYYLGYTKDIHYDIYYKDGKLFLNDRDIYKKFGFRGLKKIQEYIQDKPDLIIKKRNPKARYIYLLGNKKEKKEMYQTLEKYIKPYPKRKY